MANTTPSSNGRTIGSEPINCGSNPCGVTLQKISKDTKYILSFGATIYYFLWFLI